MSRAGSRVGVLALLLPLGREATAQQQPPPAAPAAPAPAAAAPQIDPRVRAALARLDRGDAEGARRDLEKLRAAAGNDATVLLTAADELTRREAYADAEPFARRALELAPESARAHSVLGTCLIFTDRVEEAERVFRTAAARFSGTRDEGAIVFSLGMACAMSNKRLEAGEWFRKAIELHPRSSLFLFSAAENDRNLKRFDEAEAGFRAAMEVEPRHPDAGWKLAVTLAAAGRPAEAEPLFKAALETGPAPTRQSAAFHYGVFLFEQRRPAEALPRLERATRARPEDRVAWHYLARTLRALGRTSDAAAAMKRYQALQLAADRSETDYLLGLIRDRLAEASPPLPPTDGKPVPERR